MSIAVLSRRLGRAPATITRWLSQYRQSGLSRLLEVKTAPGATPKIQGEALEKLEERLKSEEGFGSYGEIVEWLAQECQLEVKYNTVNRFVRQKLNAKLKVPRPVSVQQNPKAVSTGSANKWQTPFPHRSVVCCSDNPVRGLPFISAILLRDI